MLAADPIELIELTATAADPVPMGAVCEWCTAPDGTRLRVARWVPTGALRGSVFIANGRTEFIEKYFEAIRDLLERGFAVATMDWRGQGLSDRPLANPQKGHVADFSSYVDDLQQVLESFVFSACPAPYVLLSHSLGGHISLLHLARHPDRFRAACFSAPMWGLGKAEQPGSPLQWLAAAFCAVGLSHSYLLGRGDVDESDGRFEGNALTSDRERFGRFQAQIQAEPRLRLGGPTWRWARQALASIDALHQPGFIEAIETPIRVCTAEQDSLVSAAAQAAIAERLPNGKQIVIEGARHELLVEADRFRDCTFAIFDELMAEVGI